MPTNQTTSYRLEFLFLILAAAFALILVFPIYYAGVDFPFLIKNIIIIFIGVILFKHIFFLKYSWINKYQKLKIALIPLSVPLVIILVRTLNGFTTFIDEMPMADLMPELDYERQKFFSQYIRIEYIAVCVVAIAASIILPFKLLVSIWREVNRKDG